MSWQPRAHRLWNCFLICPNNDEATVWLFPWHKWSVSPDGSPAKRSTSSPATSTVKHLFENKFLSSSPLVLLPVQCLFVEKLDAAIWDPFSSRTNQCLVTLLWKSVQQSLYWGKIRIGRHRRPRFFLLQKINGKYPSCDWHSSFHPNWLANLAKLQQQQLKTALPRKHRTGATSGQWRHRVEFVTDVRECAQVSSDPQSWLYKLRWYLSWRCVVKGRHSTSPLKSKKLRVYKTDIFSGQID